MAKRLSYRVANLSQKLNIPFRIIFSGFVTNLMQDTLTKYEASVSFAPFLEKIAIEQDRVILKDNKRDRIAEVIIRNCKLQCLLDEKADCKHVWFVYSLPEVYTVLECKVRNKIRHR